MISFMVSSKSCSLVVFASDIVLTGQIFLFLTTLLKGTVSDTISGHRHAVDLDMINST